MFFDTQVKCRFITPETKTLLVVEPGTKNFSSFEWIQENKSLIETYLTEFGGVLLRGFNIYSISEFNRIAQCLYPNLLEYIYRSTPRTTLGGRIYTATEYPADKSIPLHNENSYSKLWPEKILFFSVIVAFEGGSTPIADSRKVYKKIDPSITKKFEDKGVLYVRNYNSTIDLSWQEVFQTERKEEVEQYCRTHDIEMEWKNGRHELTTKQICQATITHPISGESVWFNQAHLFHISALKNEDRFFLIKELGEENIPRNAFYGDGQIIEIETLDHIRNVYKQEEIRFQWHKGDIMILDNILMAHGRDPYKGERKIAVAMT